MHGPSHPLRRGTKLYDALDRIGDLVAVLMIVCGGMIAVGYASAFAAILEAGP